jgi:hypothetical protein
LKNVLNRWVIPNLNLFARLRSRKKIIAFQKMSSSHHGDDDMNDAASDHAASAAALALSTMGNYTAGENAAAADDDDTKPPGQYLLPTGYRIPNSSSTRAGRWTAQEHKIFLKGEGRS